MRQRLGAEKPPIPRNSFCRSPTSCWTIDFPRVSPLHDHPADIPVQADQFLVDRPERPVPGGTNALFDLDKQRAVILRQFRDRHTPSSSKFFLIVAASPTASSRCLPVAGGAAEDRVLRAATLNGRAGEEGEFTDLGVAVVEL